MKKKRNICPLKPGVWCIPVILVLRRLKQMEHDISLLIQLELTSQNKTPFILHKEEISEKWTKVKS